MLGAVPRFTKFGTKPNLTGTFWPISHQVDFKMENVKEKKRERDERKKWDSQTKKQKYKWRGLNRRGNIE